MSPSISSAEQCFQASERARNDWVQDTTLSVSTLRNQDFREVSKFPGTDESIFLVMIFDVLIDHVFSADVFYANRALQREVDVMKELEQSVKLSSESSRGECII